MSQELWTAVDRYITDHLVPPDPVLEDTLSKTAAAGLPAIAVAPAQGKLLHLLARIQGAQRILEIGTLGGYSTIWLARALPANGKLVTLEIDPKHAEVARANIAHAGLTAVVDVRVGHALQSLAQLQAEGAAPFDLIFMDADRPNNAAYLQWALRLSRRGTIIITDNVVRRGAIVDPSNSDPQIEGTRSLFEMLAAEARVEATAIQTVGTKGYDGFALALVTEPGR